MDHANTSPTHPTTTSSSMLVLGMMLPMLPLPLRGGMSMQLIVNKITVGLQNPTEIPFLSDIDTPSDEFYKINKANYGKLPPTPLSGFQNDHHRKPTPLASKKTFKKYDALFMFMQRCISSPVLRLLLSSINTRLRPSTSFQEKRYPCH